jgi:hypothetical protein
MNDKTEAALAAFFAVGTVVLIAAAVATLSGAIYGAGVYFLWNVASNWFGLELQHVSYFHSFLVGVVIWALMPSGGSSK